MTYLFSHLRLTSQALTLLVLPILAVTLTLQVALLGEFLTTALSPFHRVHIWPRWKCFVRLSYHRLFSSQLRSLCFWQKKYLKARVKYHLLCPSSSWQHTSSFLNGPGLSKNASHLVFRVGIGWWATASGDRFQRDVVIISHWYLPLDARGCFLNTGSAPSS